MCAMSTKSNITILVQRIASKTGLSEKDVKTILSSIFEIIKNSVSQGDKVVLRGFGSFNKKTRKSRKYRDIHTGEIRQSAFVFVPFFTFSPAIKNTFRERVGRNPFIEDIPECKTVFSSPNPAQTADLRIWYTPSHEFDSLDVLSYRI